MNSDFSIMIDSNCTTDALYCSENGYKITLFYFIMNLIIGLTGVGVLLLNSFILYIICCSDICDDVTIIFIKNLAGSDAIGGVFVIYNVFYNVLHYKNVYECAFRFSVLNTLFINSFTNLLGLTVDRYVKIISPYAYLKYFNDYRARIFVLAVWTVSVVYGLLPLMEWNNYTNENSNKCGYFLLFDRKYLLSLSLYAMLGFLTLCCLHFHIYFIALSKQKQTTTMDISSTALHLWWRPTKRVLMFISLNAFAIIPTGIYIVWVTTGQLESLTPGEQGTILVYVCFPAFLTGIVNPVLYSLKVPFVRRALRRKFGPCLFKTKIFAGISTLNDSHTV